MIIRISYIYERLCVRGSTDDMYIYVQDMWKKIYNIHFSPSLIYYYYFPSRLHPLFWNFFFPQLLTLTFNESVYICVKPPLTRSVFIHFLVTPFAKSKIISKRPQTFKSDASGEELAEKYSTQFTLIFLFFFLF